MIVNFYDIESLINVFTLCNYKPNEQVIEVYYLIDDNETVGFDPQAHGKNLLNHILAANKNYHGGIELYDLHNELSVAKMAMTFGLSDLFATQTKTMIVTNTRI